MRSTVRPLTAELLGTFFFVFIGAGAIALDSARNGFLGLGGVAFAQAFAYAIAVTAAMHISGGHLNPAVTFAVWVAGKVDARRAGLYVAAQLLGAVLAALAVKALMPAIGGAATSYGLPRLAPDVTFTRGIFVEAVMVAFLVTAFFGTVVSPQAPKVGGFAVGLVLIPAVLVGGPLSGAALNPARAFGPAIVAMDWHGHLAYWIGPLLGAAVAAFLWAKVLLPIPGDREP